MNDNHQTPSDIAPTLLTVGEKRLLEQHILPLVNPRVVRGLAGDDCGVLEMHSTRVYASTDRVPWNLTAHRLGLMSKKQLGYYLSVLNISDVAAMGGVPVGLLINFALPPNFLVEDLLDIIRGVMTACAEYDVALIGGDLSDSIEPSLSATIIGDASGLQPIYRTPADAGDMICVSGEVGLTPTAFAYFDRARPRGMTVPGEWEDLLRNQLTRPMAQVQLGRELAALDCRRSAMDNTDGLGQTVWELTAANQMGATIFSDLLPIHPVSKDVAQFLDIEPARLVLGAGADFRLVATVEDVSKVPSSMTVIGEVSAEVPSLHLTDGSSIPVPKGWNYFIKDTT